MQYLIWRTKSIHSSFHLLLYCEWIIDFFFLILSEYLLHEIDLSLQLITLLTKEWSSFERLVNTIKNFLNLLLIGKHFQLSSRDVVICRWSVIRIAPCLLELLSNSLEGLSEIPLIKVNDLDIVRPDLEDPGISLLGKGDKTLDLVVVKYEILHLDIQELFWIVSLKLMPLSSSDHEPAALLFDSVYLPNSSTVCAFEASNT